MVKVESGIVLIFVIILPSIYCSSMVIVSEFVLGNCTKDNFQIAQLYPQKMCQPYFESTTIAPIYSMLTCLSNGVNVTIYEDPSCLSPVNYTIFEFGCFVNIPILSVSITCGEESSFGNEYVHKQEFYDTECKNISYPITVSAQTYCTSAGSDHPAMFNCSGNSVDAFVYNNTLPICGGPCEKIIFSKNTCYNNYFGINAKYYCGVSTAFYDEWWFWVLIAAIGVIIVVIIVGIFIASRKKPYTTIA